MLTRHLLHLYKHLKLISIIDGDPFHGVRVAISIIDCKALLSFAANFELSRHREVRSASLGGRSALANLSIGVEQCKRWMLK